MTRLVVVLGYSDGSTAGLHPRCAARLAHAARVAGTDDVVVLSGWARGPGRRSEAELMCQAWAGRAREVVVDPDARTTVANARAAITDLRWSGATEIVVVTSSWHAPRATAAVRWLSRGTGVRVRASRVRDPSRRAALREAAVWPLLPLQLALEARRHARLTAR
jgi:hypothetical protein